MHQTAWRACRARRQARLPQRAATSLPGRLRSTLQGRILNCFCSRLQLCLLLPVACGEQHRYGFGSADGLTDGSISRCKWGGRQQTVHSCLLSACCRGCCAFCLGCQDRTQLPSSFISVTACPSCRDLAICPPNLALQPRRLSTWQRWKTVIRELLGHNRGALSQLSTILVKLLPCPALCPCPQGRHACSPVPQDLARVFPSSTVVMRALSHGAKAVQQEPSGSLSSQ